MMNYGMAGSCLVTYFNRLMEFTSLPIPQRKGLCRYKLSFIEFTSIFYYNLQIKASIIPVDLP